jgi:hypothetical protein
LIFSNGSSTECFALSYSSAVWLRAKQCTTQEKVSASQLCGYTRRTATLKNEASDWNPPAFQAWATAAFADLSIAW